MATYPVKMLKDKDGTLFVPLVNSDAIIMNGSDTLQDLLDEKQDTLVSGTNIKTINNTSLLGSGNITISTSGVDNEVQLYNFICNSVIPGDDNTNDTFIINVDTDIRPNTFVYDSTAIYTNVKLGFNKTLFEQCYGTVGINIRLVKNDTTLKEFNVYKKNGNDIDVDYIDNYGTGTWDYGNNIIFNAKFDCSNSIVTILGQDLLFYDDVIDPMKQVYNIAIRKQDALSTQIAYSAKGSATKVPQITTNNLGQVTNITEVTIDMSGKEDTSNKVTSISSSSTNTQYPSALAVYNYINSLNGNGVSY